MLSAHLSNIILEALVKAIRQKDREKEGGREEG